MLDELVERYIKQRIEVPRSAILNISSTAKRLTLPTKLDEFKIFFKNIETLEVKLKSVETSLSINELKQLLENAYKPVIDDYINRRKELDDKYGEKIEQIKNSLEEEAKKKNLDNQLKFNEDNSRYVDVENKRKFIQDNYNDLIIKYVSLYGISSDDITVDNSSFELDHLSGLYDEFIKFLKKDSVFVNPVTWFRENVTNKYLQVAILIILFFSLFTVLFDFIAIGLLVSVITRQMKTLNIVRKYTLLYGLVYNVHPLDMGFKDEYTGEVEKENLDDDDLENNPEVVSVLTAWEKESAELESKTPEANLEEDRLALVNKAQALTERFFNLLKELANEKSKVMSLLTELRNKANEAYNDIKSKTNLLGSSISGSFVFDTNFRLGIHDDIIEESYDVGLRNIVLRPAEPDKKYKSFLQVLLANALCNVRVGQIEVTIYDPNGFGQDLIGFYRQSIDKLIHYEVDKLQDILDGLKTYAARSMKLLGGRDINTFNAECEMLNKTPREYRLLIILSQPKTIEEDEALSEFMRYSSNLGIFIWIVTNKDIKDTCTFNVPFQGVANPYFVDTSMFPSVVAKTLEKAQEENKNPALLWNDFAKIVISLDKLWFDVTDQFVKIYPGFLDGDPTMFPYVTVGNVGDIHALGVGGTGAGKSVYINNIIITMCRVYSPSTLELWLIDYKGTEFNMFLNTPEHPFMLPHIKACLCTSDGAYAHSLYKALRVETERRFQFLKEHGYKNIYEWNVAMRKQGTPEKCFKRIIFINDEFQVIFQKVSGSMLDEITTDLGFIAKLGRAAGVHFMFFSQSMKGTVPEDILQQATLRFGLRCDTDVSLSVMGAETSSSIKQNNGYLYVRTLADKKPEDQRFFRTPYIPSDVIIQNIKLLSEQAVKVGYDTGRVIEYDENVKRTYDDLKKFYSDNSSVIKNNECLFICGERMTYSDNAAPYNFQLVAKNNKHVYSIFMEYSDIYSFFNTIMFNISQQEDAQIFINSQIHDLHYLCEVDNLVGENLLSLSDEKCSVNALLTLWKSIYDERVRDSYKTTPMYIILLGWDKADGFGIDADSSITAEFSRLLQLCGEFNMHFIFISSSLGSVRTQITSACQYTICGRCDEDASMRMLENKQGCATYEIKNGWAFCYDRGSITRFKLYNKTPDRALVVEELVM